MLLNLRWEQRWGAKRQWLGGMEIKWRAEEGRLNRRQKLPSGLMQLEQGGPWAEPMKAQAGREQGFKLGKGSRCGARQKKQGICGFLCRWKWRWRRRWWQGVPAGMLESGKRPEMIRSWRWRNSLLIWGASTGTECSGSQPGLHFSELDERWMGWDT